MNSQLDLDSAFEKFRPYLRLLAQTNLGEVLKKKVDASDVVQQTLLQAHRDRDDFRGENEAQFAAWLKQILRNRILDMNRHWHGQKRDVSRDADLARHIDDSFQCVDDWLAASQTSPSMAAHGNDMTLKLSAAIEQLPEDLQNVIVMHHLQGMKLVEIAASIGCDETTVGRRLFRAVQALSKFMKE